MFILLKRLSVVVVLAGIIGTTVYLFREQWIPLFQQAETPQPAKDDHDHDEDDHVQLSPQARANLGLKIGPLELSPEFWRTMPMPGTIQDRPGQTDRSIPSPITGVVSKVHAFPSDLAEPGQPLFTIRLTSEQVQNTQAELFKAAEELKLLEPQLARLEEAIASGAIAENRAIELRNQRSRLQTQIKAARQLLQARGLNPEQIDEAAAGRFVREVQVLAPASSGAIYEVQELKVQPGDPVQAGLLLGMLADHRELYIEGRAFRSEAAALARATEQGWPVEADFREEETMGWQKSISPLFIRHLSNIMDASSRTLSFYVPLANESRSYVREGKTFLVWRFRPGQRVTLRVPIQRFENVYVLPAAAVVRRGPEAYVFRLNKEDEFERTPVRVRYEDSRHAIIEPDDTLKPGVKLALNNAAVLMRVLEFQGADGHHDHDHDH
jgi:multidrug efflux pump subunit AcrA (membrane-fusion protein)